jgi:tRNA (guanine9-N1)-methyltransferase
MNMETEERPAKMRKLSRDNNLDSNRVRAEASNANHVARDDHESQRDSLAASQQKCEVRHNEELPAPDYTAPIAGSDLISADCEPMSKNQRKKLLKKQEWEAKRDDRKAIRKEKTLAKRERKRVARRQQHSETEENLEPPHVPPLKKVPPNRPMQLPVTILIDCDFDDLMRDNERISLAAQITRSYSDNKNSLFRSHLAICSFNGHLRERFENVLSHYKGWRGVRFLECDFVRAAEEAKVWMSDPEHGGKLAGTFAPLDQRDEGGRRLLLDEGEVVYLSSEATDTLTELKPYSTYIIGGLVDKNREKGICYKRATARGVKTAKLPIGDYLQMSSRKVLATNHVNEIMIKWLECGDWGEAFMKVIPKRKGGKLKGQADEGGIINRDMPANEDAGGGADEEIVEDADGAIVEAA